LDKRREERRGKRWRWRRRERDVVGNSTLCKEKGLGGWLTGCYLQMGVIGVQGGKLNKLV